MSQLITCPNCRTQNRADAKFCRKCRTSLAGEQTTVKLQGNAPAGATTKHLPPAPPAPAAPSPARPPVALPPVGKAGPARDGNTEHLPPTGFEDLPPGAIFEERYEVIELLGQPEAGIYVYQVQEISTGQRWTLFESADRTRFAREVQFSKLNLEHPGLVRIQRGFEWLPYGEQPRGYLVSEYPQVPIALVPQVSDLQIARWGAELAEALAFLHDHKIFLGGIDLSSLVVVNGHAKFTDLGMASALPAEGSHEAQAAITRDIHDLATVLSGLYFQVKAGQPLSPALGAVLQRELASSNHFQTAKELALEFERAAEVIRSTSRVKLLFDCASHEGQKREINEDTFFAQELLPFSRALGRPVGLFLVADGMGGAAAGEVASKLAVDTITREVAGALSALSAPNLADVDWGAMIKHAVEQANRTINSARQQAHTDMGTTSVGALVVGAQAFVFNVGDSRAYLLTRDGIRRISHDHSLVQSFVDSHQIREDEVRMHPQRNFILRNLGDRASVEVDLFREWLEPGQCLLFCSDGLWEMVPDADIHRTVTHAPNPKQACEALVELANRNGGDDNITVVLVQVEMG